MSEQSENPLRDAIAEAISSNDVLLFMKGTPEQPACGFSSRAVGVMQAMDVPFSSVDILPDPRIRQELTEISNWPTIPQLFVKGELVGGSDIMLEMYETGELAETLGVEPQAVVPTEEPPVAETAQAGLLQPENRLSGR